MAARGDKAKYLQFLLKYAKITYTVLFGLSGKGENMTELRDAIAKNICKLRTDAGMTQAALAEVLNYSDKAVSKWERSESVPDVFMLKRIAEYFGVTIDYLLEIEHTPEQEVARVEKNKKSKRNKTIVSLLAGSCC